VATVATLTAVSGKENADRFLFAVWFPVVGAATGGIAGSLLEKETQEARIDLQHLIGLAG
jgi:hypothetical protein